MTPEQNLKFLSGGWGDFTEEEMKEVQAVMHEKLTDADKAEIKRSIDFALNYAKNAGKKWRNSYGKRYFCKFRI